MAAQYICLITRGDGDDQRPRWVDWLGPKDRDMDIFFDRLVIIKYKGGYLAPGIIFTNVRVLTSFNPFRSLKPGDFKNVNIVLARNRTIWGWRNVTYDLDQISLTCAREVLPLEKKPAHWHDKSSNIHSPMHDLMVLRATQIWHPDVAYQNSSYYGNYTFNHYPKGNANTTRSMAPLTTFYANMSMTLGKNLKFASLAFKDDQHIEDSRFLRSVQFKAEDNVLVDCDEWLPKEWGYFICLRNIKKFKAIGSGAMLFHQDILFGVGSFYLQKGGQSILVFTDVRPYHELIDGACSDNDD